MYGYSENRSHKPLVAISRCWLWPVGNSNGRNTQALPLQQFTCAISKFRNTAMGTRCKPSTKLAEVG